jgi:hypothetical protein
MTSSKSAGDAEEQEAASRVIGAMLAIPASGEPLVLAESAAHCLALDLMAAEARISELEGALRELVGLGRPAFEEYLSIVAPTDAVRIWEAARAALSVSRPETFLDLREQAEAEDRMVSGPAQNGAKPIHVGGSIEVSAEPAQNGEDTEK